MQRTNFEIGLEFECGGKRWRCTDLGTRTVIAIALEYPEDPSWYNGPPYAVAEAVLDEYDIKVCKPVEDDPEIRRNLMAVENAVAQQRLEGLAVPPEVFADMERPTLLPLSGSCQINRLEPHRQPRKREPFCAVALNV